MRGSCEVCLGGSHEIYRQGLVIKPLRFHDNADAAPPRTPPSSSFTLHPPPPSILFTSHPQPYSSVSSSFFTLLFHLVPFPAVFPFSSSLSTFSYPNISSSFIHPLHSRYCSSSSHFIFSTLHFLTSSSSTSSTLPTTPPYNFPLPPLHPNPIHRTFHLLPHFLPPHQATKRTHAYTRWRFPVYLLNSSNIPI